MNPGRKIRIYDKEFKVNAVKLYTTGDRSLSKVREELGIPNATLYNDPLKSDQLYKERFTSK